MDQHTPAPSCQQEKHSNQDESQAEIPGIDEDDEDEVGLDEVGEDESQQLEPIGDDEAMESEFLEDGENGVEESQMVGDAQAEEVDPFGDTTPSKPELIEIEDTPMKDSPGDDFEVMKAAMEESAQKRARVEDKIKEVSMQLNATKKLLASKYFGAITKLFSNIFPCAHPDH